MFVLDCSVTMAWLFDDLDDPYAAAVRDRLRDDMALVPSIWPLEVGNALLVAERRKRVSKAESLRFVELLGQLPIDIGAMTALNILETLLPLARDTALSAYDASYLELAATHGVPLATLDKGLKRAARRVGVPLVK